ncbi:MAG: hypothetical protein ACKV2T_32235 [Kofleriaceae bacterium]
MLLRSATLVPVVLAIAGCSKSSGPAAKLQQAPPTVASADSGGKPATIEACTTPARADLMVVDWTPEARGDLEVAMKEGLALLAYDCKSAKLVPSCSLAGAYAYIGTTKREKKVEMSTSDMVAANLPVSGVSWLTEIGGKFGRETALLAQMVMIGKRSSAKKVAQRGELEGTCTEATHYVRAATVGAFAVASGSKAEIGATATLMGKGGTADSKSATKLESQDGDMAACDSSTPDAKQPPAQCGAIVRIELEPIGAAPAEKPELVVASCAPGFVVSDGACVRPDVPHQCSPTDAAACKTQCDAGNAGSCATAAAITRDRALALKACDGGVALGCRVLGQLATKPIEKIAPLDSACAMGDGGACVDLGLVKLGDKKLAGDAQYAFRRACYGGGEFEGCTQLGMLYVDGKGGMTKSPKLAKQFFEKACKEGSQKGCDELKKLEK